MRFARALTASWRNAFTPKGPWSSQGELAQQQAWQVEALVRYAYLAKLRFDNGYTSYIEVLDAERSLFQAQLQLTQTQSQLYFALINLYKALGGGWVNEADKLTPRPTVDITQNPPIFP